MVSPVKADSEIRRTVFYLLDKSIKTYRQFAQRRIAEAGFDITVDQWLVMRALEEYPQATLLDIADVVFKDTASLTRIIDLLVKKGLLRRTLSALDRRRFDITFTEEGQHCLEQVYGVVQNYRELALQGINPDDIETTKLVLTQLISNCVPER